MKKFVTKVVTGLMVASMALSCAPVFAAETTTEAAETTEAAAEEEPDTGDASKDDPRNQDEIGEKEILVVSFGTSYNDNRVATIGAIEQAIADKFEGEGWSVRRAFTADIIINHVKERDGEVIDNVEEALKRARDNGVKQLVVQPTHLMAGLEYEELTGTLTKYEQDFDKIEIGQPLLASDDDKEDVAEELVKVTKDFDDGETAIVFMGHGTNHESNDVYAEMQDIIRKQSGSDNYFVGVVHDGAKPDVNDVLAEVQKNDAYKKVVLRDMMVVAGDHANNDMADKEDPESWYSIFTDAGYEVETVLEGLGQVKEIQEMYVDHCEDAVEKITGED